MAKRIANLAVRHLSRGHVHRKRPRPRPPHRRFRIWLTLGQTSILLEHREVTYVMSNIRLDQTSALSIEAIDAAGNAQPAVIDSAVWTNSNDTAGTLAATDATAAFTPAALGETTVSVTANANGQSFSASITYTVVAAPVVITGIRIVESITPA